MRLAVLTLFAVIKLAASNIPEADVCLITEAGDVTTAAADMATLFAERRLAVSNVPEADVCLATEAGDVTPMPDVSTWNASLFASSITLALEMVLYGFVYASTAIFVIETLLPRAALFLKFGVRRPDNCF